VTTAFIVSSLVHHDVLEFPDGEVLLLTSLCEGQHATVLQLPVEVRPAMVKISYGDEASRYSETVGSISLLSVMLAASAAVKHPLFSAKLFEHGNACQCRATLRH
jgi:hypothetical protein